MLSRKNIERAWEKVKKNQGSAGIDDVTIAEFEERKGYYLDLLHRKLREGTYRPYPVRRVEIPKPDGGVRRARDSSVLDRVCQQALVQRMEPIFEPQLSDCAFGYRKGRSPHMAMRKVWQELKAGHGGSSMLISGGTFATIPQGKLVDLIAEEISDGRVLQLIREMLRAGSMKGGLAVTANGCAPRGGGQSVVRPIAFSRRSTGG